MHDFQGELLIGGMRLRHLQGKLEQEELAADSRDWLLAGHLRVPPQQGNLLEVGRRYLLLLDDGREALVELTGLTCGHDELLANFQPRKTKPR